MGLTSLLKGNKAEQAAVSYLKKNGYKVVEKNFSSRFGEIDIIAYDQDVLAFIEVKFRKNSDYGSPASYVDLRKQGKIIKTALFYLSRKKISDINIRFDVVALEEKKRKVTLLKNAFEMEAM